MNFGYRHLTLGGTFDHLHAGHEALLRRAFAEGETVWLGVTTEKFISDSLSKVDKWTHLIEPFAERKKIVEAFLEKNGWLRRAQIIPIDDRFGTTLTDPHIEAIVVSPETKAVALEINELRKAKGWRELFISEVPWVLAKDSNPIHSVRIRAGEIDEKGNLFTLPTNWGTRRLSWTLRERLKKPLGTLFTDPDKNHEVAITQILKNQSPGLLVTVGDAVTDAALKAGIFPSLSIVDFAIERKKVYESLDDFGFPQNITVKKLKNTAGTLSFTAFKLLGEYFTGSTAVPTVIVVDGEEDLLTLLVILRAPLHTTVLYGQPGEGVVAVDVTIQKKSEIREYLFEFEE